MKKASIHFSSFLEVFPRIKDPLFENELIKSGEFYEFEAGDKVQEIDTPIKYIPFLVQGSVKVYRIDDLGRELFLYTLTQGKLCAVSLTNALSGQNSQIELMAAESNTIIYLVKADKINNWINQFEDWKEWLIQTYAGRFNELFKIIDSIAFKSLEERMIEYLEKRSKTEGQKTLKLTHQSIANELGSSREVISRLLKQAENKGTLKLSRNKIEIMREM